MEQGTINELLSQTKSPEERSAAAGMEEHVFRVKSDAQHPKRRKMECYNCHQEGHIAPQCPSIQCHLCKEKGHIKRDCPKRRQQSQEPKQHRGNEAAKNASDQPKTELLYFLGGGDSVNATIGGVQLKMVIDSGCKSNIIGKEACNS